MSYTLRNTLAEEGRDYITYNNLIDIKEESLAITVNQLDRATMEIKTDIFQRWEISADLIKYRGHNLRGKCKPIYWIFVLHKTKSKCNGKQLS